MTISLDKNGHSHTGHSPDKVLVGVVKDLARHRLAAEADLTDGSTGTAETAAHLIVGNFVAFVDVANAATSLATKADFEASLLNVADALTTVFAKANALAVDLGLPTVVYDGLGTDGAGTIAAIDSTITPAATGSQATETEVLRLQINDALFSLGKLVNRIAEATGMTKVTFATGFTLAFKDPSPGAAIDTTATGTAADPGITAVAADAALASYADDIATFASALNLTTAAFTNRAPEVVIRA